MFNFGHTGISKDNPRVLGQELAGVIKEVGGNISEYKKGMQVTVAPNMGCGLCQQCLSGIIDVKSLISARFPLKEINETFDNAIKGVGLKNIIIMN